VIAQGATLGWTRGEIEALLPEIFEFAGLKDFVDMPVGRYSRGMNLRLAFSSVVNLRPDLLLVDDVLGVGDKEFQTTCLERLRKLADEGATVRLATHDMNHVTHLCDEVLWLKAGRLMSQGPPSEVVPQFAGAKLEAQAHSLGPEARSPFGEIIAV